MGKVKNLFAAVSTWTKPRIDEVMRFLRSTWVFLTFLVLLAGVLFIANSSSWEFWAERTYDPHGAITEVKIDRLKIIQQIGLFFAAVIGLTLAIWRSLTSHRQAVASLEQSNTAIKQAEISSRQAEIAENNQRFDRYARAAQMLDSEKSAVRQAGIYLLRELAIGDEKYRDLCAELLASFVRARIADALEKLSGLSEADRKKRIAENQSAVDVVDALKSLCRAEVKEKIDLTNTVFSKFTLDHPARFLNLDFSDAHLYLINLHRMRIARCDFSKVVFRSSAIHQVSFSEHNFYDTTFDNVDFEDVDFRSAEFWYCTFKECTFRNCNMSGVKFRGDDGDALPNLKDSWAWKDSIPELGATKFTGIIYEPGPGGKERTNFAKEWEARRLQALNYSDIRPAKKLIVLPS